VLPTILTGGRVRARIGHRATAPGTRSPKPNERRREPSKINKADRSLVTHNGLVAGRVLPGPPMKSGACRIQFHWSGNRRSETRRFVRWATMSPAASRLAPRFVLGQCFQPAIVDSARSSHEMTEAKRPSAAPQCGPARPRGASSRHRAATLLPSNQPCRAR
jgi:hypothetical protein